MGQPEMLTYETVSRPILPQFWRNEDRAARCLISRKQDKTICPVISAWWKTAA